MQERKWYKEGVTFAALFCLVFIFMFQSPLNPWTVDGDTGLDSSVFKTVALYMERGYMPYKDTFDHKGPLLYIINWIGLKLSYWRGIWFIEFASLMITFCFLYKTARLICDRFRSLLTLLLASAPLFNYFLEGNLVEEYALPFIAIALFVFSDFFLNNKISRIRLAICGSSFGAVCLLRPNMIAVWVVFCIAVLIRTIKGKRCKDLLFFVLWFLLGAAIAVVPILFWLFKKGAFQDFLYDYIIFNGLYSKNNYHTSVQERVNSFITFFKTPEVLIAFLTLGIAAFREKDLYYWSSCGFIFVTLLFICVSGMTYEHYGMILIPALIIPFSVLLQNGSTDEKIQTGFPGDSSAILIVFLLVYLALPPWLSGVNRMASVLDEAGEDPYSHDYVVAAVSDYVKYNTDEEDRIAVWGSWDIIYAKSQRLSATKYSYVTPIAFIDEKVFPDYYAQLEENKPKMIIKGGALSLTPEIWEFMDQNGYVKADIDFADIYELPDT